MTRARILSQTRGVDPADPEGLRPALVVTYSTETVPPRIVYVPGEDPTEDEVRNAIRADLAARQTGSGRSLEV